MRIFQHLGNAKISCGNNVPGYQKFGQTFLLVSKKA
jgi:hypothetical protein